MTSTQRHPLTWVPSLYLAMGLPNVMVGVVAAIIYKNLGVSNADIALYTSQMYLPWVLKPLWAPLLEAYRSKRFWVISMEFTMAAGLASWRCACRWRASSSCRWPSSGSSALRPPRRTPVLTVSS